MEISKEGLEEFKRLWVEEYGETITDDEARLRFQGLLAWIRMGLRHKSN